MTLPSAAPRNPWIARAVETSGALDDMRADRDLHRSLYRAAYGLACDALIENVRLERLLSECYEERNRFARQIFGRTPGDEQGEDA